MNLKEANLVITLTSEEAYELACMIKHELINSINEHWKNFDKELFYRETKEKRKMMALLYQISGYGTLARYVEKEFEEIFDKNCEGKK